ncbi:unnamed protein product, partial [Staurois parvus]
KHWTPLGGRKIHPLRLLSGEMTSSRPVPLSLNISSAGAD